MDMKSKMSYLRAFPILSWHTICHSQTFLRSSQGHPAYIMLQKNPPTVLVCDTNGIWKKLALIRFSPYQVAQRSEVSPCHSPQDNRDVPTLAVQSLHFDVPYHYFTISRYFFLGQIRVRNPGSQSVLKR